MQRFLFIAILFLLLGNNLVLAQDKTVTQKAQKDSLKPNDIDPLTPAKAAFYSAVLPGLGRLTIKNIGKFLLFTELLGRACTFIWTAIPNTTK